MSADSVDAHAMVGTLPYVPVADASRVNHPAVGIAGLGDDVAEDGLGSRRAANVAEAYEEDRHLALVV